MQTTGEQGGGQRYANSLALLSMPSDSPGSAASLELGTAAGHAGQRRRLAQPLRLLTLRDENCELVAEGPSKIIVPTGFRSERLGAMRRRSRDDDRAPGP